MTWARVTQPTSQASELLVSDKSLVITSCTVYLSWMVGNWGFRCHGPPGCCAHGVLVQSGGLLHFLLLMVHMGPRGVGSLGALGKFLFPSHLARSVFMAALHPKGK